MRFKTTAILGITAAAMGLLLAPMAALATPVQTELLLLVDVSGSIDTGEFALQRSGYVAAFQDATVQNDIINSPGGIAVALGYWSSSTQQSLSVGWTHLTDAASANAFATAIGNASRPFSNNTAVQSALNWGAPLFANNGFEGSKLIMDVSGDGVDNDSPGALTPHVGRDNALVAGVDMINGLVVGGSSTVATYYQNNVLGGSGAFLVSASDFGEFDRAIQEKIHFETTVPEPTTLLLLGAGLAGLALKRRKRGTSDEPEIS
jgi:hypothetical protein